MEWFKFYGGEYLSDPKMHTLSAADRSCWLTLLSYASLAEDGGRIKHLTEEQLMIHSGITPTEKVWGVTQGVLKMFADLGMIILNDDASVTVKNWGRRQGSQLSGAQRQKRFRERNALVTDSVTPVTESNAKSRIDKNRIEYINTSESLDSQKYEIASEENTPKTKRKDSNYKKVYRLFPKYDPSWDRNTTQQRSASALWEEKGEKKIINALKFVEENRSQPYFPNITSPYDLDMKWGKLLEFRSKHEL